MILKSSEDGVGWESWPEWLETQALNGPSGVVQAPESVMSSFENICDRKDKFSNKNPKKNVNCRKMLYNFPLIFIHLELF